MTLQPGTQASLIADEPAFSAIDVYGAGAGAAGLSKLEYFMAAALPGVIQTYPITGRDFDTHDEWAESIANLAWLIAEASMRRHPEVLRWQPRVAAIGTEPEE